MHYLSFFSSFIIIIVIFASVFLSVSLARQFYYIRGPACVKATATASLKGGASIQKIKRNNSPSTIRCCVRPESATMEPIRLLCVSKWKVFFLNVFTCIRVCVCLRARKKETNLTKEYSAYKYILYYIYVNNCPSGRVGIQFWALYSHLYI